jgi:predicted enzyme related to lactoylglutathione lyase
MTIRKLMTMTVFVSDQERAKAFYTERLGFDVRGDHVVGDNRWLEVAPPGGGSGIVLHPPFPGTAAGTTHGAILASDDIDADCAALAAAGVAVDGPHDMPWGRQATFNDPDGNGFVLSAAAP